MREISKILAFSGTTDDLTMPAGCQSRAKHPTNMDIAILCFQ